MAVYNIIFSAFLINLHRNYHSIIDEIYTLDLTKTFLLWSNPSSEISKES